MSIPPEELAARISRRALTEYLVLADGIEQHLPLPDDPFDAFRELTSDRKQPSWP